MHCGSDPIVHEQMDGFLVHVESHPKVSTFDAVLSDMLVLEESRVHVAVSCVAEFV